MNDPVRLKIELPNIPGIELVALDGLSRLARHLGIADDKTGEAQILVTEAIINAFEHGSGNQGAVNVEFTINSRELIIFVEDHGKGFDPSAVETPELSKKFGTNNKRGWGLKLLKSMSDDFRIETNTNGTKITVKKLLT